MIQELNLLDGRWYANDAHAIWDEFRREAVRAAWFPENGREAAILYLHMAHVLRRMSARSLERTALFAFSC